MNDSKDPIKYNFHIDGKRIEMSQEEFDNLVMVFRTLARWQQELDANKRQEEPQGDSRTNNNLVVGSSFRYKEL